MWLFVLVNNEIGMYLVSGREGRGDGEKKVKSRTCLQVSMGYWWEHDIIRTGVVCCCFSGVKARGAWRLFDCQSEPVARRISSHLWEVGRLCFWVWHVRVAAKPEFTLMILKMLPKYVCYVWSYESILFQVKNWCLCCILNENYGTACSWWQSVSQLDDSSALI